MAKLREARKLKRVFVAIKKKECGGPISRREAGTGVCYLAQEGRGYTASKRVERQRSERYLGVCLETSYTRSTRGGSSSGSGKGELKAGRQAL